MKNGHGTSERFEVARVRAESRFARRQVRRSTTLSTRTLKMNASHVAIDVDGEDIARPLTRADCAEGERPCPFVACRHNLFLDVSPKGAIKLNFPDREPDEMLCSCALDVAERGGTTLDEVGVLMNVTRERARQIELEALPRLRSGLLLWMSPDELVQRRSVSLVNSSLARADAQAARVVTRTRRCGGGSSSPSRPRRQRLPPPAPL
jgi:hypothetical protein